MKLFPTTIAVAEAFCNRVAERQLLKRYIKHGRHTVVIAPRRYDKTSLVNQVLLELKQPYCLIELTIATSIEDIERIILKNISSLLYSLLPKATKAKQNILKLFKWLNPELVLTVGGQKLVFHPDPSLKNAAEDIAEILVKVNAAAQMANKKVTIVIDEFQQLQEIRGHNLEASIRHAMQYSTHVSYVFSGSNRHMLLSMFNNKNRPFYNSCEIMQIHRISISDYEPFIQRAAEKHWKKQLPKLVLDKIFQISERHPSYINRVCGYFWLTGQFPTEKGIEKFWDDFVESKRSEFSDDILGLSINQRKILSYITCHPTEHPSSKEVCGSVGISEASARQAVKALLQKDFIYRDNNKIIHILDPAFKKFIQKLAA
jgi:hypothetical protein